MNITRFCLALILFALAPAGVSAQDMPLTDVLIENEPWQLVSEGYKFTEGPAIDGEGNLFFTDIPNNRIHRIDAQGNVSVFIENSQATNGLKFGPDGRLYGCQNGARKIVAFDADGNATTIADDVESNDLVITKKGGIYFTDIANKRVWYVSPEGKKEVVDTGIARPNGLTLWPGDGTLVVTDSAGPNLWAFRIEADGKLAHKAPYYTMQTPVGRIESGADGMTVDSKGRLYVTTRMGLQMFDPTGRLCGAIAKPHRGSLSNVVFAGPELDTLYVTAGDKVFRRKTKAKGLRSLAAKSTAASGAATSSAK